MRDELVVHLGPVLLGVGTPMFAGEALEVVDAPGVTHIRHRVR